MSPAAKYVRRLRAKYGQEGALSRLREQFASLSAVERAGLENRWDFWARSKQLPPNGSWQSWGFLTGRGFGKTLAVSKYINQEAESGRAMLIGLAAQDEQSSIDIQVKGPSGLIATAPHWFKPEWAASELQLVWPNGARAYVRTPEVPGKIRGLEYHLAWLSELQSWPLATREEAYMNFLLSVRLGYARIVWDSTARKRHPILKKLLKAGEDDPTTHVVVRGRTDENPFLARGYQARLEAELGGTQRGREELLGEMLSDSDDALIHDTWINGARRNEPDRYVRQVIGIDPAITVRSGNDETGISLAGLGVDGQCYVIGDYSGKHKPAEWAAIVLRLYQDRQCDCIAVERNAGGDLVAEVLRAHADKRGLTIVTLGKDERPRYVGGTVYIREVHARGSKEDRAQPLATAYERGRVSHVNGADLAKLEETLTTWEPIPGRRSPDDLDALVHAATELLGLSVNKPDPKLSHQGFSAAARAVSSPGRGPVSNLSQLLGGGNGGGRI